MHTRPATRADIPSLAHISFTAWMHDEYNAYVWPKRFDHPESYKDELAQRHRSHLLAPASMCRVVVAGAEDAKVRKYGLPPPNEDDVMGLAYFSRLPDGKAFDAKRMPRSATMDVDNSERMAKQDMSSKTDVLTTIERALVKAETWYFDHTGIKSAARDGIASKNVSSFMESDTSLDRLPSHWHVGLLGTDPRYEGRGVGRMLVQEGKKLAKRSGTPLTLTSAPGRAQGLYTQKESMSVVGWMGEIGGTRFEGGAHCVWDPWHLWIKDCEERTNEDGRVINADWIY